MIPDKRVPNKINNTSEINDTSVTSINDVDNETRNILALLRVYTLFNNADKIKELELKLTEAIKKKPNYGSIAHLTALYSKYHDSLPDSPYTAEDFAQVPVKKTDGETVKKNGEGIDLRPKCPRCGRHHWSTENCDESA